MITLQNISSHELIGLPIKIQDSTNPNIVGLSGKIVNETKSMFVLNTAKGLKMIPKSQNIWKFYDGNEEITLHGSIFQNRSYDRLGAKKYD